MRVKKSSPIFLLFVVGLTSTTFLLYNCMNFHKSSLNIFEVVNSVDDGDLLAGVFWDVDGTDKMHENILNEVHEGTRDKVYLCCHISICFIF